jgi:hypothetical protein
MNPLKECTARNPRSAYIINTQRGYYAGPIFVPQCGEAVIHGFFWSCLTKAKDLAGNLQGHVEELTWCDGRWTSAKVDR